MGRRARHALTYGDAVFIDNIKHFGHGEHFLTKFIILLYHSFALSAIFSCMARKRVVTLWERVQGFKNS
ncbi:hypothetical protein NIA69_22925 [Gemmiger formicilis]|nr:hypothetical protein [Gemmiger formicilis]